MRPQTRRAVGAAAGIQRGGMERVALAGRLRPKADVDAAARLDRRHIGAKIDPELRIALAEADRRGTRDQARQSKRRQRGFIKARGAFEVADADGDMIDHGWHSRNLPSLRGALATKQSILSFTWRDGLLRGACHRAALRADPLARNDGVYRLVVKPSRR